MTEVLEGVFPGRSDSRSSATEWFGRNTRRGRQMVYTVLRVAALDQRAARYSQTPLLRLSRRPSATKGSRPANVATLDTLARSDYLNATSE